MKGERKLVAEMIDNAFLGAVDFKKHGTEGPFGRIQVDIFFTRRLEDPKKRPLFVTHLPTHRLLLLMPDDTIDRSPDPEKPDWWIGGMQKFIVDTMYLAIDYEDDDFIYVFYHAQNDMNCLKMLGRTESTTEFCKLVRRAYKKFMRDRV